MSAMYHLCSLSVSLLIYLLLLVSFNPIHTSTTNNTSNVNTNRNTNECDRQAADSAERIVVVKLGGSSITDKGTFETLDQKMLDWVASTLSDAATTTLYRNASNSSCCTENSAVDENMHSCCCYSNNNTKSKLLNKFVIVHGAGSFGHQVAKKYGLKGHTTETLDNEEPPTADNTNITYIMEGLAQTRLSVTKLNWHVVQTLLKYSLPAVGVSPFSVGLQAHGDPIDSKRRHINKGPMMTLMNVIRNALQVGLTPVLHGDAVLYGQHHAGILSGDTLVSQISVRSELNDSLIFTTSSLDGDADGTRTKHNNVAVANQRHIDVVFLTDVDGVYTSDPKKDNHAILIPIIEVDADGSIISTFYNGQGLNVPLCLTDGSSSSGSCSSMHEHDVTGGLQTKLASAIEIAKTGINVYILKCGSTDAIKVIRGEQTFDRGTLIRLAAQSLSSSTTTTEVLHSSSASG